MILAGSMQLSPFTRLLKTYLDHTRDASESPNLKMVLESIIKEHQILNSPASLNMLVASFRSSDEQTASIHLLEFVDDCILRLTRKPIRYYDSLTKLRINAEIRVGASDSNIDLLLVSVLEQWPFLVKSAAPPILVDTSNWLERYIRRMWIEIGHNSPVLPDGGDNKIIVHIRDQIKAETPDRICMTVLGKALTTPSELGVPEAFELCGRDHGEADILAELHSDNEDVGPESPMDLLPAGPPKESEDHPGLDSWSRDNIPDAVSGGSVAALMLCLCSEHAEIRKQALGRMRALMGKLEVSDDLTSSDLGLQNLRRQDMTNGNNFSCWLESLLRLRGIR